MIRKNVLCHIRYNLRIFFVITAMTGIFIFICCAQSLAKHSELKKTKVTWENCVAFRSGEAIYIDFKKLVYGEMELSESAVKNSKTEQLKDSIIDFIKPDLIYIYDSLKNDRHRQLSKTEKIYNYKIVKEKTYIGNRKGEWTPLKIKFLKNLEAPKQREEEYYPCMVIYLECKWFSGEYEINCD